VRVDFDGMGHLEMWGCIAIWLTASRGIEKTFLVAFEDLQGANSAVDADEGVEFDAAFTTGFDAAAWGKMGSRDGPAGLGRCG